MTHNQNDPKISRRVALQSGGVGLAGLALLASRREAAAQVACTANPAQTEGPYWVE